MNLTPLEKIILLFFSFMALLVGISLILPKSCERDAKDTNIPNIPAETTRQRIITGRDKQNEKLAAELAESKKQNKADSALISYWKGKYTTATKKGATIEIRYRNKPDLATCDTLLNNKEERIAALKSEIAVRKQDSLNKETMLKTYAEHLFDKDMRIDSLSAGWQAANKENEVLKKKVRNKNKLLKVGAGVIAALGIAVVAR